MNFLLNGQNATLASIKLGLLLLTDFEKTKLKPRRFVLLIIILLSIVIHGIGQNLLSNGGFENDFSNWTNLANDGAVATYSIVANAAEGAKAMRLKIDQLGSNGYSIQNFHNKWPAEVGQLYKIEFFAKSQSNAGGLRLVQTTGSYKATSFSLTENWEKYQITYVARGTQEDFKLQFFKKNTYFIDGISITPLNLGEVVIPPSGNSSLKDLAGNCGVNMANLGDRTTETEFESILRNDFNMVGSENSLKMKLVKPQENSAYQFANPDRMVAYAQNQGMKVRGHTIIWHNGMPDWVNNKNWTKQGLLNYLKGYIDDVVGRYKGQIDEWDVANEFVENDGSSLRKGSQSVWMRHIGPEVLDSAFKWVHEADPDAKLYYNDYGAEGMNSKSDFIYNLVKGMQDRGIPIHGVGMQCHFKYDQLLTEEVTLAKDIDKNIKRLGALGLEVAFTEIDIAIPKPVSQEKYQLQAITYGNLLKIALNNTPVFKSFMIWGITDKYTWIRTHSSGNDDDPLLYTADYQKKPAYDQMVAVLKANCIDNVEIKEPFLGTPILIPGTIQAENYDKGGQGVSYSDADPENKGGAYRADGVDVSAGPGVNNHTVGWSASGEWLEYTVRVKTTGAYTFDFFTAAANLVGQVEVLLDGQVLIATTDLPVTNNWGAYESTRSDKVDLTKGEHLIRIKVLSPGYNIDKVVVNEAVITSSDSFKEEKERLTVFPNPSNTGEFRLSSSVEWELYSIDGLLLGRGNGACVKSKSGLTLLHAKGNVFRLITE